MRRQDREVSAATSLNSDFSRCADLPVDPVQHHSQRRLIAGVRPIGLSVAIAPRGPGDVSTAIRR
jgi:hypothetical protein